LSASNSASVRAVDPLIGPAFPNTPADEEGTPKSRRHRSSGHWRAPWWFVVPGLAFYLFVIAVPAVRGATYSFTSWNLVSTTTKFIGLQNFRHIFDDPLAVGAIRQTLYLTIAITIGLNVVGLLLALGVQSKLKTRNLLRVLLFAPAVVAPIMTAFIWQYILSPFGALNTALADMGLASAEQDWLGSPSIALWSVAGVLIWQFSGFSMVIYLAGLESIPADITEAAEVDGARTFTRFRHVTLPLLAPAAIINVVFAVIMGLKQFDTVWIMTEGGPANATQTLSTLVYQDAFQFNEYGYAIALSVVLAGIVLVIAVPLYRTMARRSRF
jgi:raffinose/stachyose/melibiose transport system permease protein